jgi:hypothetical protein
MANLLQNRRQILKRAGVLGALAALFSPASALAQSNAQPSANAPAISGSWRVNATPQGTGSPTPFQGLHTFTADGTITTAEQRDLVPPTLMSSGHGSWVQLPSNDGPDDFAYNYQKLVVDAQGNLLGTIKVHVKIELASGGQAFTGTGTSVFQPVEQAPGPDYVFMLSASRI